MGSDTVELEEIPKEVLLRAVYMDTEDDDDKGTLALKELVLCESGIVVGISVDLVFSVAEIIIVSSVYEVESESKVLLLIELEETCTVVVDILCVVGNIDDIVIASELETVSETLVVVSKLDINDVDSTIVEDEETISDVLLYAVGIDTVEDNDVRTVVLTELFSIELCVIGVVVGISVDLDFSVAGIIIVSSAEEEDSETTILSLRELAIEPDETDLVSLVFEEDTSEVTDVDVVIEVSETANLDDVVSETSIVGSELIADDVDSSIVEDEETTSEVLLYVVGIETVEDTDVGTVVLTELFSLELCVIGVVVGISVDLVFSVAGIIIVSSMEEVDSEDTVELSTITLDELFFEVYSDTDDVIGAGEVKLDAIEDVSVPNDLDTYDDVGIVIVGVIVRKVYPGDGVLGVCIVEETSEDVPELLIDVEVKLEDDSDTVLLRCTENEVSNTEIDVS